MINFKVGIINKTTFKTAFKEWKFCLYELDQLRKFNWMECPACDEKLHSVHVDGNMKFLEDLNQQECKWHGIHCLYIYTVVCQYEIRVIE